ncbi:C40 family peptidase [Paenibacillus flagellatus]|uniref:NlpC/P60 domain-containing protein n=1 Tax=Paenibacillus flagellatus TaxID=2211139 RepID=A0A2V5JXA9_9BACL|nr:C40 family peptidase [Paenibacillus flagellatus]PYI51281.1 hypothetical protein DLM86_24950 [Paenibacillus flagellatus]
MWKKRQSVAVTAALAIGLTGLFANDAYAAYDDMDAVSLAQSMVGKDYKAGAQSPSEGFDYAGLVYFVFQQLGYEIPRDLKDQYAVKKPLLTKVSDLLPGDVLFFGENDKVAFTGIYVGDNKFVMANRGRDEVVTLSIADSYYKNRFEGARRILSEPDQMRVQLILTARKYLGTPYVFGADFGQTKTFDCSSFAKTVFAENDMYLPRVSRDQATKGVLVKRSDLKVGDLVFFTTSDSKGKIGHVGIYVGNGRMIHTYGEGGVKYSRMDTGYWDKHYVTARRVLKDG